MITVAIGGLLGAVGLGIGYHAVAGINEEDMTRPGWVALVAACVSIGVKEALYRWNIRVGRRARSSALLANAWHHRSDALSSVPVAVAVLGTRLWPAWGMLDHVAAVIVCVLIVHAACQTHSSNHNSWYERYQSGRSPSPVLSRGRSPEPSKGRTMSRWCSSFSAT